MNFSVTSREESRKLQNELAKSPKRAKTEIERTVRMHLRLAEHLGFRVTPGQRILDIGCGLGESVGALTEMGFDAEGIDVLEWWGADYDQYWSDAPQPDVSLSSRLHKVDVRNYRIPFPDEYFDFAFSDQVFEHVFNPVEVMAEIGRVLRPGAVSIHQFPGPNGLVESHLGIPLTALCKFRWWVSFWAVLGRRSSRQHGFSWRKTLETNTRMMEFCNYLTKSELKRAAVAAGVHVEFIERVELGTRPSGVGRMAQMRDRVPRSLRPFWVSLLCAVAQRCMTIRKLSA